MPAKEEIIEDAETLFHLVVQFPDDDDDEGDQIDCGIAPSAEFGTEEAEELVHPSKRKISEGALPSSISGAKRPRQTPESPEILDAAYQSDDDGYENKSARFPGAPRPTSAARSPSDLPDLGVLRCHSISPEDVVDGSHMTLPAEARAEKDNKKILSEIAGKLRFVGDDLDKLYRGKGDSSANSFSVSLTKEAVEKLVSDLTYENFKETVIKASVEDPGLQQFVCVFSLAKAIANKARKSSAAQNVNAFYTRYFTSNLADWVDSVGGWIITQDGAPAHRAREAVELLAKETPDFMPPNLWPPNSLLT